MCPVEYSEAEDALKYSCDPSPIFRPQEYALPETLANFSALVSKGKQFYNPSNNAEKLNFIRKLPRFYWITQYIS